MIELAWSLEAQQRLGIDYLVGDGRDLGLAADYDLAVAAYFLNYAHDPSQLNAMCRGIARCLRPSGRFVTVNSNPACDFRAAPSYRKYGFETSVVGPFREGVPITWTFYLDDGPLEIENYFLSVEIHEEALHAAGFRNVLWHQPMLSPDGAAAYGHDYWSTLLDHPPIIFIDCVLAEF